ncbi:hypothetical protein [Shewanella loihica]|uniref:hypothetical protein n=1 Tax=Shewanella loihica TaxID=359303 RepID=UPI001231EFC3|nr:hypothetical protein [Shewanella loihica]
MTIYRVLILTLLLQGCFASKQALTEADCSALYRKGWNEFLDIETVESEITLQFPKVVSIKQGHLLKWFYKSNSEIAICKAISNNDSCGAIYSSFNKEDGFWVRGEDIVTICSGHPR